MIFNKVYSIVIIIFALYFFDKGFNSINIFDKLIYYALSSYAIFLRNLGQNEL